MDYYKRKAKINLYTIIYNMFYRYRICLLYTSRNEIESKYGKKLENRNLEEIIDLENIHGWLQNRIHSSEARLAAWIKIILQNDLDAQIKLEKIFQKQGVLAAREAKIEREYNSASDIYNSINNYILDGMPCDRVNVVSVSEENLVSWKRRICVHEEIWSKEGVDVRFFYNLRKDVYKRQPLFCLF